jgi:hypothetical protein
MNDKKKIKKDGKSGYLFPIEIKENINRKKK